MTMLIVIALGFPISVEDKPLSGKHHATPPQHGGINLKLTQSYLADAFIIPESTVQARKSRRQPPILPTLMPVYHHNDHYGKRSLKLQQ